MVISGDLALATDVPVVSGDSGDEVSGNGGNVTVACFSAVDGPDMTAIGAIGAA